MANKIVEGLWDCPYCGSKAIRGLTKHCPSCGHPQDNGTRFYMGEKKNYLDEEMTEKYGKGADWTCAYCGSLNRYHYKYCTNCAAPKEESSGDYFDNQKKLEEAQRKKSAPAPEPVKNNNSGGFKKLFLPLMLILVAVFMLVNIFGGPKNANVRITDKSWERSIAVEGLRTIKDSNWVVPDGGRVYSQREEIHHYEQVVDHYEQRSRQVPEQVLDGYDTHTTYDDNGDGTFTERSYETPRYRTEYHTEYYNAPVYRDEPVYAVKYYYELDTWPVVRTADSSGKDEEPYWAEVNPGADEREGASSERYTITVENLKKKDSFREYTLPQEEWEKLKIGEEAEITYKGGRITNINGHEVQ